MRTATRHAGALILFAFVVTALAGCETPPRAPEGSTPTAVKMAPSPELATAVEDYREARYQASFDRAKNLSRSSTPPLREQAAWIAGLSAYQMRQLDEAELQFMVSERSQDSMLVADSKVMIGDIRVLQNRWSDAAQCYRDAAAGMSGKERADVLDHADKAAARASGGAGSSVAQTASTPSGSATSGRPSPGVASASAYSLQAGAFQSESNARRRANEIAGPARQAGLGEPRVIRTRDAGGREFWAVQVGSFANRESAESAKSRVSSLGFIVTSAG